MLKFKKGDKVRVGIETVSFYRSRIGTVDNEPPKSQFWYMVKFDSKGFKQTYFFSEQNLESV